MCIPDNIRAPLKSLSDQLHNLLGSKLEGVYVHGSLAYGGFNENSDIDLLVVVNSEINELEKNKFDGVLLELFKIYPDVVANIELDTIFTLDLTDQTKQLTSHYSYYSGNSVHNKELPGFWLTVKIVREKGIVLHGKLTRFVIPEILTSTIHKSLRLRFSELKTKSFAREKIDLWNQVYLVTQFTRMLHALQNNYEVVSKQAALEWGCKNVPDEFEKMLKVTSSRFGDFNKPREQEITDNWINYTHYIESKL